MKKDNLRTWAVQGMKFIIVGFLNTGITMGTIFVLTRLFKVHYIPANATGYTAGLINSFIWNRNWTFKSRGNALRQTLFFLLAFGICYTLQLTLVLLLVEYYSMNPDIAQIMGMIVYTGLNFLINKLITFRKKEIS
ncbi:MAG: GtrA family protein [Spirochaetaceae bacterium]|nr:GtrA family protein [Spirochaetaceae bacterium]